MVISENAKLNLSALNNKVKFIKKIIDYVYPNMVFSKVKEDKKLYKIKSLELKLSQSKLALIQKKREQKNFDIYMGKSLKLIKI